MIDELFEKLSSDVDFELKNPVSIVDAVEFPNVDHLPLEKREWTRLTDVYVVASDLRNSTKLNFNNYAPTSASFFQAVTGSSVRIVNAFKPEYVDIQGDGIFAIFHGDTAAERAVCAAISLKSFSEKILVPAIDANRGGQLGEQFPDTGLKIGVACGRVAVKRVGVRGDHNEAVWAGRPVAFAAKAAEACLPSELRVTEKVFNAVKTNDYVMFSCGCPSGSAPSKLWAEGEELEGLPGVKAYVLKSNWCDTHGDEFCEAILAGQKHRDDVST
jgi:class 3 adenylate cyclase